MAPTPATTAVHGESPRVAFRWHIVPSFELISSTLRIKINSNALKALRFGSQVGKLVFQTFVLLRQRFCSFEVTEELQETIH